MKRRIALGVAVLAAVVALAACRPVGYDNLMLHRCFVDNDDNTIIHGPDCGPGSPQDLVNQGNAWVLSQGPATLNKCNYNIVNDSGPARTLAFADPIGPTPFGNKPILHMAIQHDACQDNTEIAYDVNNGQGTPIWGLHTFHGFANFHYHNTGHVAVQAYIQPDAGDQQAHTISLVLPPYQANQPSAGGNWASGCVKWHGSPKKNHHFLILDGGCFGFRLCESVRETCNGYTHLTVDWTAVLNWIHANTSYPGWSADFWNEVGHLNANIHVELDTFTPAGGPSPNTVSVDQDTWSMFYCDGGFFC